MPYALLRLYLAGNRERGSILKNSNIYDKSTPMSGDYDANGHVRCFSCTTAIQPTGRRYYNQENRTIFMKMKPHALDKIPSSYLN